METIVFLGSQKSGTSRDAIRTAAEMGYFNVLFTNKKKHLREREAFSEVHEMIYIEELLDKDTIVKELNILNTKGKDVKAVVSFIDPFVSLAAELTGFFGLVTLSVEALYTMEDKWRFREKLKGNEATPFFSVCSLEEAQVDMIKYHKLLPLVIKSPKSSGSKDVLHVETEQDLNKAIRYFQRRKLNSHVIIEEYLKGPQYLVEVVVNHSEISVVAIIDQEVSSFNRFIITGYEYPTQLSFQSQAKLIDAVKSIVCDLGLQHGTCHLELRLVNGQWKLIEINPRMAGGAMNQLILEATGINLVKETIKLYLGKEPSLLPTYNKHVFAQFVTVDATGRLLKVTGKTKASKFDCIKEVYIKPHKGSILTPPLSMGNRYAFVLASSEVPNQAKEMAKLAAKEIRFYLEPL
ncbi:MAG: ATP-grasp domain-containing protein [Anaerobacillus sp.]|uniref:ATP-grasp domain-containing protein n=1 Tax=Anaerobacillus sp. TaxID=1872506 RepID=UPI003919CF25